MSIDLQIIFHSGCDEYTVLFNNASAQLASGRCGDHNNNNNSMWGWSVPAGLEGGTEQSDPHAGEMLTPLLSFFLGDQPAAARA